MTCFNLETNQNISLYVLICRNSHEYFCVLDDYNSDLSGKLVQLETFYRAESLKQFKFNEFNIL